MIVKSLILLVVYIVAALAATHVVTWFMTPADPASPPVSRRFQFWVAVFMVALWVALDFAQGVGMGAR